MQPGWMTDDDVRILELLEKTGAAFTPKGLAFSLTDVSYYTVGNRLPVLHKHGFIELPPDDEQGLEHTGVYRISELGRRFLSGDITLREMREQTD